MDFNTYQNFTKTTAKYPGQGTVDGLIYVSLGASGETGEINNKVKKIIRDSDKVISEDTRLKLVDEVSDVLWYISQMCTELGTSFESVATRNIAKLTSRLKRGTIHGSGDNR